MEPMIKMTKEQAVAKIREHFSKPGAVLAWDEKTQQCVYRGGNDPKSPVRCALGCLIPDELYNRTIEGSDIDGLPSDILALWDISIHNWLRHIQHVHDGIASRVNDDHPGTVGEFLAYLGK